MTSVPVVAAFKKVETYEKYLGEHMTELKNRGVDREMLELRTVRFLGNQANNAWAALFDREPDELDSFLVDTFERYFNPDYTANLEPQVEELLQDAI